MYVEIRIAEREIHELLNAIYDRLDIKYDNSRGDVKRGGYRYGWTRLDGGYYFDKLHRRDAERLLAEADKLAAEVAELRADIVTALERGDTFTT